jgi:hypothetical protein
MSTKRVVIREIAAPTEGESSVSVIRDSFKTVADEFGLTMENCPAHPSFLTIDQLNDLKSKGVEFFGLFLGNEQVGFIAAPGLKDTCRRTGHTQRRWTLLHIGS